MPVSNDTDSGGSFSVQRPRPTGPQPVVEGATALVGASTLLQGMSLAGGPETPAPALLALGFQGAPTIQVLAFLLSLLAFVALVYYVIKTRAAAAPAGAARAVRFLPLLTLYDEGQKIPIAAGASMPMPAEFVPGCRFAFYNAAGKQLAVSPEVFSAQARVALTLCTRDTAGGAAEFHCHVSGDTLPA